MDFNLAIYHCFYFLTICPKTIRLSGSEIGQLSRYLIPKYLDLRLNNYHLIKVLVQ